MIMSLFLLSLSLILIFLMKLPEMNVDSSQFTLFECGFESKTKFGIYSLQFFSLALSFIAFDFEIFVILPYLGCCTNYHTALSGLVFIVCLLTLLLANEMMFLDVH
uniref:NADH-ubiquinone oxidoreductase chain 3 n=1 Tax=Pegea confoederata TaxID=942563 RepID=A0AA86J2P9_9UROC|nr:NADH dehydrogenase subunit 3 [Pegea confoederata]